jgi:hypothetical protein
MTRGRSALVGLLVAAPFYWLLVDTGYEPDLIAGAVVVLIAAAAYSAAGRLGQRVSGQSVCWRCDERPRKGDSPFTRSSQVG